MLEFAPGLRCNQADMVMPGKMNHLLIFARYDLVSPALASGDPAALLEGSWPAHASSTTRWSLDDALDARFDWIDEEASRLAERLAGSGLPAEENGSPFQPISFAWLNALGLRYHLVKLIRPVAYFTEVRPLCAGEDIEIVAARGRDEDYAEIMAQLSRLAGASLRVRWIDRPERRASAPPPNNSWRRAAAWVSQQLEPRWAASSSQRRVVLCGNPRLLDPISRELLRHDCRIWWLYDRFAIRAWLRWRIAGVGQLVCDSSQGRVNRLRAVVPEWLECRGLNLAGPISRWTADRLRTRGPRQTRLLEQIDAHFRHVRPHAVILDEDATPMARAAVGLARSHRAASFVVQHGAPCCRFGFAPLAADRVFAWGRSSKRQLVRWGVPPQRIHALGSPRYDLLSHSLARRLSSGSELRARYAQGDRPPRILLVTTVPPRDDRPDYTAFHVNRRTYAEMVRTAVAAVAEIPGARLVVKLHPRTPEDPIARAVLAGFPSLNCRLVTRGPLEPWLARTDCVLSCATGAGVDATLAGVPVVQLLPAGSGDVLPHEEWGMFGTARSEAELRHLLPRALAASRHATGAPEPIAFADLDGRTAERIAEAVLVQSEEIRAGEDHADSARLAAGPAAPVSACPATPVLSNTT